jgi:hypothetical protein
VIHMRWHKDGERENKEVMVHPSDSDAWKVLDNFDPDFAQNVRNVHIGLARVCCFIQSSSFSLHDV